jgi:uncharacterized damage-inducible protein DinB
MKMERISLKQEASADLAATRRFFDRTTSVLTEADSGFRATPETMTVTEMVAHVAQTLDWLRVGGFEDRWRSDWEAMIAESSRVDSLAAARQWLAEAWERLRAAVEAASEEKLAEPMPDNPFFPGRPRYAVVKSVVDHTGHHRGALGVYARLLGKVPPMVYGEG